MDKRRLKVVTNQACFSFHNENKIECKKKICRNWISSSEHMNCAIIAANTGKMTLHEIGKIFGLTRMRICQIEKRALQKIKQALGSYLTS